MGERDSNVNRLPPQAPELESAVLGAMMMEKEAVYKVFELIDESCFYKEAHRIIFSAMRALFERNEAVDVLTVSESLKKKSLLEKAGGTYYLTECVNQVTTAANVEYHTKVILEKALLRKLIEAATKIAADGYAGNEEAYELLDRAEQLIFEISEEKLRKGFVELKPLLHGVFEQIDKFSKRKGYVTGVPTGFVEIDQQTSGFQNADLIIIAGRPSMGKTAFCLNIARNVAIDHNIPVGMFSLEMADHQVAMRLLCTEARVSSHEVKTGRVKSDHWQRLSMSVGSLSEAPIYIDDSGSLSILELRSKARRLKVEKNVGLIIVDYLQLIRGSYGSESRQQEISFISRSLKALAKELNLPVVALSQLSRAVEKRGENKRPILSDLRESGAIEQDADVVMFIHRPSMYPGYKEEEENLAEIIIAKQRNGPIGNVKLSFLKEFACFETLEHYRTEVPVEDDAPF